MPMRFRLRTVCHSRRCRQRSHYLKTDSGCRKSFQSKTQEDRLQEVQEGRRRSLSRHLRSSSASRCQLDLPEPLRLNLSRQQRPATIPPFRQGQSFRRVRRTEARRFRPKSRRCCLTQAHLSRLALRESSAHSQSSQRHCQRIAQRLSSVELTQLRVSLSRSPCRASFCFPTGCHRTAFQLLLRTSCWRRPANQRAACSCPVPTSRALH